MRFDKLTLLIGLLLTSCIDEPPPQTKYTVKYMAGYSRITHYTDSIMYLDYGMIKYKNQYNSIIILNCRFRIIEDKYCK